MADETNWHLGFWIVLVLLLLLFMLLIASIVYAWVVPVRTREALFRLTDLSLSHEGGETYLGHSDATILVIMRLKHSSPSLARVRQALTGLLSATDLTGHDPTQVAELILKELEVVANPSAVAVELFLTDASNDNMSAAVVSRGVVTRPMRWDPKEA